MAGTGKENHRPRRAQISFKQHRFPPKIIQHAVWLYARFMPLFRNVEDLLAERGIDASNETVRRWFLKFGWLIWTNFRGSRPVPALVGDVDQVPRPETLILAGC